MDLKVWDETHPHSISVVERNYEADRNAFLNSSCSRSRYSLGHTCDVVNPTRNESRTKSVFRSR